MNKMILAGAALAFFLTAPTFAEPQDGSIVYPEARRTDYTELIHGKTVADPYRWMENIDSPETKAWIKAENEVTEKYMSKLPERKSIRARLDQLSNYEKYGCPWREGGRWFYFHNSGLQNQSVLYTMDSLDGSPRVLLDPNTFTKDGTAALSSIAVSPDGKYLSYGVADAGSDWNTWHVLDIETGKKLPDKLEWIKFSGASWDKEGQGFFYSRYPAPAPGDDLKAANRFHVLYYHKVGTLQADDKMIFGFPNQPDMFVEGSVSDDGKWLIINAENPANGNTSTIVRDLTAPGEKYIEIPGAFSSKTYPIEVCQDKLLLFSNRNAPNYRVL
ncbi:MAG: S9 family peptidase, partial [bacterium]|nr:S9 family peptidase [bacterium]